MKNKGGFSSFLSPFTLGFVAVTLGLVAVHKGVLSPFPLGFGADHRIGSPLRGAS
jgi:hypothetical protein